MQTDDEEDALRRFVQRHMSSECSGLEIEQAEEALRRFIVAASRLYVARRDSIRNDDSI